MRLIIEARLEGEGIDPTDAVVSKNIDGLIGFPEPGQIDAKFVAERKSVSKVSAIV